MNVAERSFAREVVTSVVGVLLLLAAVVVLVDGVELARRLAVGELDVAGWLVQLAGRVPGRIVAALPVAAALGAARVGVAWAQSGRLVAVRVCGFAPSRLARAALYAALGVGAVVAVVREGVAPWAARAIAGQGVWVVVPGPAPDGLPAGALAHVRADTLGDDEAFGVRASWTVDGVVVGYGSADHATNVEGTWSGGGAWLWTPGGPRAAALVLPDPVAWREAAAGTGVDASAARLWASPASPGRSAWLAERVATPVGAALMAAAALPLVWAFRRWGTGLVLGGAIMWRLAQGGALAAAARGQFGLFVGVGVPLMVACAVTWWLLRWVDRRVSVG